MSAGIRRLLLSPAVDRNGDEWTEALRVLAQELARGRLPSIQRALVQHDCPHPFVEDGRCRSCGLVGALTPDQAAIFVEALRHPPVTEDARGRPIERLVPLHPSCEGRTGILMALDDAARSIGEARDLSFRLGHRCDEGYLGAILKLIEHARSAYAEP